MGDSTPRPLPSAATAADSAAARQRLFDLAAVCVIVAVFVALVVSTRRALTEPLWYNEQWRAHFVSVDHNWWSALQHANAPMSAAWFATEHLAIAARGNRESTLRLANVGWLLVAGLGTYALARRWLSIIAAVLLALVVIVNGMLLPFALQLAPYAADAAGTVIAVAALLYAREAAHTRRRIAAFGVACFGLTLATPAVFVVGPIIGCLLYEWWSGKGDRLLLRGSLATLAVGGLHLFLFVMRQDSLTKGTYWDTNFVPHSNVSAAARFVWDQTRGFVPWFITGGYHSGEAQLIHLTPGWTTAVGIGATMLLALGVWHAALTRPGQILLFGTAGALPLTLVASWMRLWPYGFERTNLYLVPLLYLICGLGVARLWVLGGHAVRAMRSGQRRVFHAVAAVTCLAGLLAAIGLATVSASVSLGATRAAVPGARPFDYGRRIDDAVIRVRTQANASTAVVVVGRMAFLGWQYYMFERRGVPGTAVPPSRTDFVSIHGSTQPARFLVAHPGITRVYYYGPSGLSGRDLRSDTATLATAGFCARDRWAVFQSGVLMQFGRCSAQGK